MGKLPYDYRSLMHYRSKVEGGVWRIEPLYKDSYPNLDDLLGTEEGFSTCDIVKINTAYKCNSFYEKSPKKCRMGKN
uniref:Peptidase M12A domain-containing protein n=1 Tax=Romanomermis culicivorax TaxID=13658 RepID=A0A915I6X8_ROMCU